MKRYLAALCALALCAFPLSARADIPFQTATVTVTATGTTQPLPLSGQSTCSVYASGTGTGLTIVPQATSAQDIQGGTYVTAAQIGGGSITANGTYVGSIAVSGTSGFRLNVTAITGGSETLTYTCSSATGSNGSGGGSSGSVTVSSITLPYNPSYSQTATNGSFLGVAGYNGTNVNPWYVDSSGNGRNQICSTSSGNCAYVTNIAGTLYLDTSSLLSAYAYSTSQSKTLSCYYVSAPGICHLSVSTGGEHTVSVASGAANTVVVGSQSRIACGLVTTAGTGTGNVLVYDNATTNSGTVIGLIPATVTVTGVPYCWNNAAANGITVQNVLNGPVVTFSYF